MKYWYYIRLSILHSTWYVLVLADSKEKAHDVVVNAWKSQEVKDFTVLQELSSVQGVKISNYPADYVMVQQ